MKFNKKTSRWNEKNTKKSSQTQTLRREQVIRAKKKMNNDEKGLQIIIQANLSRETYKRLLDHQSG